MEFKVDIVGDTSGADKGAAALRAEAAAARSATEELEKLQKAHRESGAPAPKPAAPAAPTAPPPQPKAPDYKAGSFSEGHEDNFKPSPWAQEAAGAKAAAQAAKGVADEQTKGGKESAKAGAASKISTGEMVTGAKSAAVGLADLVKGVVAYEAGLAGIHGLSDLGQLAVGWRGMAALQMTSYRAQMDVRRLVQGTDSTPLLRATAALEKNLSKSTVTGDALSGILTRGFNAGFQAIEKLEPAVSAVFQGMVLGGLEVEIAWQNIQAALAPVTVAFEDATKDVDGMGIAADRASGGFKAIAGAAESTASALATAYGWWKKIDWTGAPSWARPDSSMTKPPEGPAPTPGPAPAGLEVYSSVNGAKPVLDQGEAQAAGKTIPDGMVKGMDDGAAAVRDAGKRLGTEGVAGAREGADAHSPSKATERLGDDMIDGAVNRLDGGAPDVARAAERAFTPPAATGATSGAVASPSSSASGVTIASVTVGPFTFEGTPRDLQADVEAAVRKGIRAALIKLGIPIPGGL